MPSVDYPPTSEDETSGETRRARRRAFVERWTTDVAPVHDRTERSREFRTRYATLMLKSLLLVNGAALVAFPAVCGWIGVPVAGRMPSFLLAEGAFCAGVVLALLDMLVAYATLDVDVTRQKGERAAARRRLIESGFPEQFGDAPEAERVRSEADQARHWKIGVRLSWFGMVVVLGAIACFLAGGILAGLFLAAAG